MIDVHADLDTVTARCDGTVVASHARVWATRQTVTNPDHVQIAARLRQEFRTQPITAGGEDEGLIRDLSDYDARFGVDFDLPTTPPRGWPDGRHQPISASRSSITPPL